MPRNEKDIAQTKFEITNFTENYTFDANTATLGDTSDVLATLIRDLSELGIINVGGTVAA